MSNNETVQTAIPSVVACIKESNFSGAVCDYASWISRSTGAPLKLLHTLLPQPAPGVVDLSGAIGLGASADLMEELTEVEAARSKLLIKKSNLLLQAAEERARNSGVAEIKLCPQHGSLADALIEIEDHIRVVVAGIRSQETDENQSQGISPKLETVIRSLHKPILIVNGEYSEPKNILLAYDGNDAAEKALQMVKSSPLFKGVCCHLVYVSNNQSGENELLQNAAKQLEEAGIEVRPTHLQGNIDKVLVEFQAENDIDLMVMGAFSHSRIRGFLLGSFTSKMLARTQKPVLLLR